MQKNTTILYTETSLTRYNISDILPCSLKNSVQKEVMEVKNKKLHLNIKGRLQRLHFKFFAQVQAKKLGLLTHKIINTHEGSIEIVVEGENKKLWEMVKWCKKGPVFSTVEEVALQFKSVEIPVGVK